MSTLKVNKIENTATADGGIEIDNTGHVQIDGYQLPTAGSPSNRNMIINGDMRIAQRGTSGAGNGGFTCDRFKHWHSGLDEAPEYSQHELSSSEDTGPWEEGFRYSFMTKNGDQTSGAGAADYIQEEYNFEGQHIAQSGWDYNSSSSYITLSFWIKSSVSQKYTFTVLCRDGTQQTYLMETDTLTAGTWTKVERAIPGNSNITMTNDNTLGMSLIWWPYLGTNYTSGSENTWYEHDNTDKWSLPADDTWYTTNDATLEYTGVQLELGQKATPFEHRSIGDELLRCQRYYETSYQTGTAPGSASSVNNILAVCPGNINRAYGHLQFQVKKRAAATVTFYSTDGTSGNFRNASQGSNLSMSAACSNGDSGISYEASSGITAVTDRIQGMYTASAEL